VLSLGADAPTGELSFNKSVRARCARNLCQVGVEADCFGGRFLISPEFSGNNDVMAKASQAPPGH